VQSSQVKFRMPFCQCRSGTAETTPFHSSTYCDSSQPFRSQSRRRQYRDANRCHQQSADPDGSVKIRAIFPPSTGRSGPSPWTLHLTLREGGETLAELAMREAQLHPAPTLKVNVGGIEEMVAAIRRTP
jgi:hypothetical protein